MKNERILDALEKIDEELIDEAAPGNKPPKKAKNMAWMKWGTMAACALVIIGIGAPLLFNHDGAVTGENPEEPMLEGNIDTTGNMGVQDETGEGEFDYVTLTHMVEIKVKIDEMFPDGFRATIEVGTDLFKEGEQITVVAQDNVTVVQQDGSIFTYDEFEPNIPDSDLTIGSSVWVGFQKYDSTAGIVVNALKEPMNMMLPNLREDIRTPMTDEELYEYYDTDFADALNEVATFEERESTIPKGIYTYADGSVFDMNQFVYYQTKMDYELYVSIGKNTRCSQLVSNMDADAQSSEINGIDVTIFKTESGDETVYYATYELGECDYIISGTNIEEDVFVKILGTITK